MDRRLFICAGHRLDALQAIEGTDPNRAVWKQYCRRSPASLCAALEIGLEIGKGWASAARRGLLSRGENVTMLNLGG